MSTQELSPLEFADKLIRLQFGTVMVLQQGLEKVAQHIERVAKDEFGLYQPAVGPFPAWAELAESTKEDRLNKGYDPDEPLLRTGQTRDSISHQVDGLDAVIGSPSQIMVYHEFGTEKIPPRPVLGPAAFRSKEQIKKLIGTAALVGFVGTERLLPEFGYDAEVK